MITTAQLQAWAHATAKFLQDNGHTDRAHPVTVREMADAVGFKFGCWPRVKDQMYGLGYHLAQRIGGPGSRGGGGFYLGEPGEEATTLVNDQKHLKTRIKTYMRHHRYVAPQPHYTQIIVFANDQLSHDLRDLPKQLKGYSEQLLLPAPAEAS